MNTGDLFNRSDDPFGRQPTEGVIVKAPTTSTELLHVVTPSQDSEQGDRLRWPGARNGGALPSVGDRCLVVYTKDGTAWVSVWWPS